MFCIEKAISKKNNKKKLIYLVASEHSWFSIENHGIIFTLENETYNG
jgi:hypothetical protein